MGYRYETFHDPRAQKSWAMYGPIERPKVDYYSKYVVTGEAMPNGFYGVRDAIARGEMDEVG